MKNRTHRSLLSTAFAFALLAASVAFTTTADAQQVPDVLPYQGFVTNGAGAPVEGTANITFRLYRNQGDATPIWSETHSNVAFAKGTFYVYLGMQSDVAQHFTDGTTMYLGLEINGDGEAQPRQEIGSVPYAMLANNALNLGGQPADNFLTEQEVIQLIQQYSWKPYILGVSNESQNGSWEYGGVEGIKAANAACRDAFPNEANAHMCMVPEARLALALDSYPNNLPARDAWAIGDDMQPPGGNRINGSLGNNCQDLLYQTGDAAVGTLMNVNINYASIGNDAGNTAPVVALRRNVGCQGSYPVYCCR